MQPLGLVQIQGATFTNSRVVVDGNAYKNCTFLKCHLVFQALAPVQFDGCNFTESQWVFEGPAALTLGFLSALSKPTSGMNALLDHLLSQLKSGEPPIVKGDEEGISHSPPAV